jgi:hypothetical protein
MLASLPASMLNQNRPDLGIPNRINLTTFRSSVPIGVGTPRRLRRERPILWKKFVVVDELQFPAPLAHPADNNAAIPSEIGKTARSPFLESSKWFQYSG